MPDLASDIARRAFADHRRRLRRAARVGLERASGVLALVRPRLILPLVSLSLALAACQSDRPKRTFCKLQAGMTVAELMACGCRMTTSGGASVVSRSGEQRAVTVSNLACPIGEAGVAVVSVVDGVAQGISY